MIGRAISHYRVLSALGSGGMGVVYLAEDERLGRQVALKFLPQESLKNRQALDRFRVEARAASSLSHPGICAIYDIGEDDGMPFIVMEALRGENLRDRINKGPLKVGDLVDIGIQLADALEAAHNQGIIHRDIKPSNIFVGDKNRVKILDFGLAKLSTAPGSGSGVDASTHQTVVKQLTMPGSALGTVSYMSPEQARGEDVDTRTDLFSLGAVIYEMATGTQAFGGSTHAVVFDAILNHTPPVLLNLNPLVPQRLEEIINTLLEKDRELRCQHASDLQAELKRLRRDLDSGTMMSAVGASRARVSGASPARTSASRQPSAPAIPPPAPARSLWPYAVTVLLLFIVAAVGFTIWSGRQQVPATVTPQPATGATTPATPKPLPTTPVPEVGDRAALAAGAAQTTAPSPPTRGAAPPNQTDAPRGATSARPGIETRPPAPAGRGAPAVSPPVTISPPPVTPAPQTAAQTPAPAPTPTPPPAPQAQAPPPPAAAEPPATPPPQAQPAAPARAAETTPPPQPTPRAPAAPDIPPASPVESDDTLIRRVVATYKNAIETKNVALFRSVRPGLSAAEEARLRESFRQLDSQQITIGIDELRVEGKTAFARISRQDVILSGGRRQTQSIRQTLRFEKSGANWIITAIGN